MNSQIRPDCLRTGRNADEIMEMHRLSTADLAGKVIVDLGAGSSRLASDIDPLGLKSKVISIDLDIEQLKTQPVTENNFKICADLNKPLPLKDGVADLVLATCSFPLYARSALGVEAFFSESRRILASGGRVSYYAPFVLTSHELTPDIQAAKQVADIEIDNMRQSPLWQVIFDKLYLFQAMKAS